MEVDIDKVVKAWERDEPQFKKLGKYLLPILKNSINELELFPEISYRVKDLLSIIRKIKKKSRTRQYSYCDLKDKLGVRVICNFVDEMDILDKFIMSSFKVGKIDKKRDTIDHNKLDYISNHYDLSIDTSKKQFKRLFPFDDLVFELQVRTLNQHAWSNISHALSYKQEANLSPGQKRRIFRLLSLYEIADDEFLAVNSSLLQNTENVVYNLLRKTEGKIYKYAKVDFDRETSLDVLNTLVKYFNKEQLSQITKDINSFIELHERKIKRIFRENLRRFHEIPFLTQPEIFIIWYALEKFTFSLTDNWNNDFEEEELDQIRAIWGMEV